MAASELLPIRDLSSRPGPAGPLRKVRGQAGRGAMGAAQQRIYAPVRASGSVSLPGDVGGRGGGAYVRTRQSPVADLEHYVERARKAVDLRAFHQLGIDEFSLRKGHVYMTSFSDLEAFRVVFPGGGA